MRHGFFETFDFRFADLDNLKRLARSLGLDVEQANREHIEQLVQAAIDLDRRSHPRRARYIVRDTRASRN